MKKYKNIIFWAGIVIIVFTSILIRPLSNLDEIWNFNIARCISNGLVPYKDISMITTPALSFVTAVVLKIFGTEMFVTRILAGLLAVVILILIYKILKQIKINKILSFIIVLAITFLLKDFFALDYNFFAFAISLFIILLELKSYNKNSKKYDIAIGILGGLAFCTKQSIGILICLSIIINKLFFIKNKTDVKRIFKQILFRLIGILIPVTILFGYLLITKSFGDFIDYCVIGIQTFYNKKTYTELILSENILTKILSVCVPICIIMAVITCIVLKMMKKNNLPLYVLTVYSLAIFSLVYPIADEAHFSVASATTVILFIYALKLVFKLINKKLDKEPKIFTNKYVLEFFEFAVLLTVTLLTVNIEIKNIDTLSSLSKYKSINNFKYIYVDSSISNLIEKTDEYIASQNKAVYILDSNAAVYMIPINRYNKNYDMFNVGNLGAGGEEAQIQKIKNEDAKYLILNRQYTINWQTPVTVKKYVEENLKYVESIGIYDVYENYDTKKNEDIQNDENLNNSEDVKDIQDAEDEKQYKEAENDQN